MQSEPQKVATKIEPLRRLGAESAHSLTASFKRFLRPRAGRLSRCRIPETTCTTIFVALFKAGWFRLSELRFRAFPTKCFSKERKVFRVKTFGCLSLYTLRVALLPVSAFSESSVEMHSEKILLKRFSSPKRCFSGKKISDRWEFNCIAAQSPHTLIT